MEQPAQSAEPASGAVTGQMTYAAPTYQPAGVVTGAPPPMGVMPAPSHPQSNFPANHALARQHQLAYQQFHQQQQQHQQQQLRAFWANQMIEIEQTVDFKNHSLPLARIKKIMKADEDVRMISAEAPVIFAKACEIFILELTLRSWIHAEENKRRTLQKNDIAAAISRTDIFDFLVDIVPRDEPREEGLGIPRAAMPTDPTHYYHVPSQHQVVPPGMIMGNHVDPTAAAAAAAAMVGGQHPGPMAYMWQQNQMQGPMPQQQQQQMPDSD